MQKYWISMKFPQSKSISMRRKTAQTTTTSSNLVKRDSSDFETLGSHAKKGIIVKDLKKVKKQEDFETISLCSQSTEASSSSFNINSNKGSSIDSPTVPFDSQGVFLGFASSFFSDSSSISQPSPNESQSNSNRPCFPPLLNYVSHFVSDGIQSPFCGHWFRVAWTAFFVHFMVFWAISFISMEQSMIRKKFKRNNKVARILCFQDADLKFPNYFAGLTRQLVLFLWGSRNRCFERWLDGGAGRTMMLMKIRTMKRSRGAVIKWRSLFWKVPGDTEQCIAG